MNRRKKKAAAPAMAKERPDSPTSRRIVRSFLEFLLAVEPTSNNDYESLKIARYCLRKTFGLNLPSTDEGVPQGLLLDLFKSGSSSNPVDLDSRVSVEDSHVPEGKSKEELFGRLHDAFDIKSSAKENPDQAAKALADCLAQKVSLDELGEFFKTEGNQAMQSKLYTQAVKLYTEAISLHKKIAVYYCNRAAAYAQLNKNHEAIKDCLMAIEMDPKYTKAYFRLGSAYFALGNYHEALIKGYLRALKLDPSNQTIQEKIEVTRSKLEEQMHASYNPSQFRSFSTGSNTLNPEFSSSEEESDDDSVANVLDMISMAQVFSELEGPTLADPMRVMADAFLPMHRSHESISELGSTSEEESDDEAVYDVLDIMAVAQAFSELAGPTSK